MYITASQLSLTSTISSLLDKNKVNVPSSLTDPNKDFISSNIYTSLFNGPKYPPYKNSLVFYYFSLLFLKIS